ncbi:hypothetical protein PR003_g6502 [Phytophthora rubi]|nr:hypothetical protein PR003_g6502 [Phytophthora rubi]
MKKAHSSAYAFDVLNWFLAKTHEKSFESAAAFECRTFVYDTKSQQTNCADCGIYVLHYMDTISKHIATDRPGPIEEKVAEWASGGFNATKAAAYRSHLYRELLLK